MEEGEHKNTTRVGRPVGRRLEIKFSRRRVAEGRRKCNVEARSEGQEARSLSLAMKHRWRLRARRGRSTQVRKCSKALDIQRKYSVSFLLIIYL